MEEKAIYLDSTDKPKKRFFRSRAHCNPLSHNDGFQYPQTPDQMNWELHYPNISEENRIVRHLDIGMGFGGLTVSLADLYPDKLVLGMEIRAKVCDYVRLRIEALRKEFPGKFQNAACLRTNCMRYLPNFFKAGQLEKIFICFPDPHFKAKNHRRRIISHALLTEYAYFLAPGGRIYAITDVEDLHQWHVQKLSSHPLFRPLEMASSDPSVDAILRTTEEGKKVTRLGGKKFWVVYERVSISSSPTGGLMGNVELKATGEGGGGGGEIEEIITGKRKERESQSESPTPPSILPSLFTLYLNQ